jgi:hypothetical protein
MTNKLKVQKDFLLTEGSATKATGKIIAVWSNGGLVGVNIEQKTRATEDESVKMRKTVGVANSNL